MDAKDEVKERLSVEDVVGDYLELKRSGRNFKGKSPFTNERTASLMVSPEKQIWHDFSSGKGGDIFSFVMEIEGVDFKEALTVLARKAGVELKQFSGDGQAAKQKEKLRKANELAAKYYHHAMAKDAMAKDYLVKKRGYGKGIIESFKLGYAPSSGTALVDFLVKRGFNYKEIIDAGLGTARGGRTRDMFRGRITVPLADGQGNAIGFTARVLDDALPKYLNTPQTLIYDKSRHVFGLHLAKQAIRDKGFVVVVEGNMDVVASHKADVKNVVATAGTAMTKSHLTQLSRLTNDVRLAFDQDRAGVAATERAIPLAQEVDINVSIIEIEGGKDPDELIQQDPSKWVEAINNHQYVIDWIIEHYAKNNDLTTAQGKREYSKLVLKIISRLKDPVEKDHYVNLIAKKLEASTDSIKRKMSTVKDKKRLKPVKAAMSAPKEQEASAYQDQLLGLNLLHPSARSSLEDIEPEWFRGEERQKVASFLTPDGYESYRSVPPQLQSVENYVKIVLLKTEELYDSWSDTDRLIEAIGLARRLRRDYNQKRTHQLSEKIKQAEASGDDAEVQKLLQAVQDLLKEK